MKNYKFAITEFYFGGKKLRVLDVQARTEKSAYKKALEIQGNRDWDITPLVDPEPVSFETANFDLMNEVNS